MRAPILTLAHLKAAKACRKQVAIFAATFGESASVTKANWAKAHRAGLDTEWAVHLLDAPARDAYEAANAPARAAYEAAVAPARDAYQAAIAPAWDAYEAANASALYAALRDTLTRSTL